MIDTNTMQYITLLYYNSNNLIDYLLYFFDLIIEVIIDKIKKL